MIAESRGQTFGNFKVVAGALIYAHHADMIERRGRRSVEDAAAHVEQISSSLQCAEKKLLPRAAKGGGGAGCNHGIANLFD